MAIYVFLESMREYYPEGMRKQFIDDFVRGFAGRSRNNERKDPRREFMYGKDFRDRNRKYGRAVFGEFLDFLTRRLRDDFISRCHKLYVSLAMGRGRRVDESFTLFRDAARMGYAKMVIDMADEETICENLGSSI